MKRVIYWSPYLSNVATIDNVLKSAKSIKKYSNEYMPIILDVLGEWKNYKEYFSEVGIKVIKISKLDLQNFYPFEGFIKSRLFSLYIILRSALPLFKYLKSEKPDYLIVHLLSSLPLILLFFFNFKTKFILRISGLPQKNYFRDLLWRIVANKIFLVTCPSKETKNLLIKKRIFNHDKVVLLRDPIIEVSKINEKVNLQNENINFLKKPFLLSIGRITNQKNHKLLIDLAIFFKENNIDKKIYILGTGEKRIELEKKFLEKKIENEIIFLGFKKNVFSYIKSCEAVIITSLWEDPGAVMIEASYMRKNVICSDCASGPKEFLDNGSRGYLFKNNNAESLIHEVKQFLNDSSYIRCKKIKKAQKESRKYSLFNHFKDFNLIFSRV